MSKTIIILFYCLVCECVWVCVVVCCLFPFKINHSHGMSVSLIVFVSLSSTTVCKKKVELDSVGKNFKGFTKQKTPICDDSIASLRLFKWIQKKLIIKDHKFVWCKIISVWTCIVVFGYPSQRLCLLFAATRDICIFM